MRSWLTSVSCCLRLAVISLLLLAFQTNAEVSVKPVQLYKDGIPGAIVSDSPGVIHRESPGDKFVAAVSKPSLTAYLPEQQQTMSPAVIICPGGGYFGLSTIKEGEDVARRFASNGIAAFVLHYRMPKPSTMEVTYEGPLQDVQQALFTVREQAKSFSVDPDNIGVMGFSAGGHLAASAATQFAKPVLKQHINSVKPAFQILIYPVISMTAELTHEGSRNLLIGEPADTPEYTGLITRFSNELNVTADSPPAYLVHATDDTVVIVENALHYFDALRTKDVSVQMLIVPDGGHGFGMRHRVDWFANVIEWVKYLSNE